MFGGYIKVKNFVPRLPHYKCTLRKENECAYGHIFLALKTSMSISSDSENIFDII